MNNEIHLIDFYYYLQGENDEKLNISKELIQSLKKCGFVYIKKFGILSQEIDEAFKLCKESFQLSINFKESMKEESNFCGYINRLVKKSLHPIVAAI